MILLAAGLLLPGVSMAGEGYDAGYEWAEENGVADESECDSYSPSFNDGCEDYAREQAPDYSSGGAVSRPWTTTEWIILGVLVTTFGIGSTVWFGIIPLVFVGVPVGFIVWETAQKFVRTGPEWWMLPVLLFAAPFVWVGLRDGWHWLLKTARRLEHEGERNRHLQ